MLTRTVKGLTLSLTVGLAAGVSSVVIASVIGLAAALTGPAVNRFISWLTDLFLSVPHLVTLLFIAFVLGGGSKGIIIGVALTHWPSLSRVLRAEVMQIRTAPYVAISRNYGKSRWWIATRHIIPQRWPYTHRSSCNPARSFHYFYWHGFIAARTCYWHYIIGVHAIFVFRFVVVSFVPWNMLVISGTGLCKAGRKHEAMDRSTPCS
ncbi:ABC transporter permease [Paenibacillus sp. S-38]|uniref:ABC transporter permease n=1 Tax=Paenibacillus sp. S-38 TaxID=3416710 RepID=UPI003CEC61C2